MSTSSNLSGTVRPSAAKVCRTLSLPEQVLASLPMAARSLYRALSGWPKVRIDAALIALLAQHKIVRLDGRYSVPPQALHDDGRQNGLRQDDASVRRRLYSQQWRREHPDRSRAHNANWREKQRQMA
jgi:hypothetical protein